MRMTCRRRKCTKLADRNTQITVYRQPTTITVNDDGEVIDPDDPTKVGEWWASVMPTRGRERPISDQIQAEVTHIVKVPYDSVSATISPRMWIITDTGERLNILRSYDPDRTRSEMAIEATEKVTSWD